MEQSVNMAYKEDMLSYDGFRNEVLNDYRIGFINA